MAMPRQTDPQFKLRISPELKRGIEAAADANNRSMNAEIIARLEAGGEDLRDKFAMAALSIARDVCMSRSQTIEEDLAAAAYKFADAMLAERAKR